MWHSMKVKTLIHEADPQSWPVVITIFARVVCPSVRPSVPTFQNFAKQKLSGENSDRYWRDCGSDRVDHWWHTCLVISRLTKDNAYSLRVTMTDEFDNYYESTYGEFKVDDLEDFRVTISDYQEDIFGYLNNFWTISGYPFYGSDSGLSCITDEHSVGW